MIEPIKHLKKMRRINTDFDNRLDYLRLDKNEFVGQFPSYVYDNVINKLSSEHLQMYPEYGNLKEKIANYTFTTIDNIILGNGSDSVIKNIFETYITPRDNVLFTNPTFAMYPIYCNMFGAHPHVIEYTSLDSFPKKEFMSAIKNNKMLKMAVIVNPNNPTGHAVNKEFLIEVTEEAEEKNILMVIDEAYHYYYKDSVVDYVEHFDNLIVLRTFSKFFGIAGLRIGFALSHPSIVNNIKKVQLTYPVSSFAVAFAEELLDSRIIQELYNKFIEGKTFIVDKLKNEGIPFHIGEGNFLLIHCDNSIIDKLKKRKILVSGNYRQDILKGYIRVSIGHKENMKLFWNGFKDIYEDLF